MTDYVDIGRSTRVALTPPDPDNPPQDTHDGYPDVIATQRNAYGVDTVAEVEAVWIEVLARRGLEPRRSTYEVVPYINRARWLVDCPECNTGNFAWDHNPRACCLDCGLVVSVKWQNPFERARAVRLLAVRPIVNCNWNAHKGETVDNLELENRWLLNEPSVEKNGLVVPVGLDVPDALAKYGGR